MEEQLQAVNAVKVNMGMTLMKEVGAKWWTVLYDKLCTEVSIVVNGFKILESQKLLSKMKKGLIAIHLPFECCLKAGDS